MGYTAADYKQYEGAASQSVEILPKGKNNFIAGPGLLIGQARHFAIPVEFNKQQYLLIAGGEDEGKSLQLYDVKHKEWFFVGRLMQGCNYSSRYQNMRILPFLFMGNIWTPPSDGCNREFVKLRMPAENGQAGIHVFDKNRGLPLLYSGRLLAETKDFVVMRTTVSTRKSKMSNNGAFIENINLTDIVWRDGHIQTLSPYIALPPEVKEPDEVNLDELPPLSRARRDDRGDFTVKQLDDGRVIVAGGDIQTDKIAVLTDKSMSADEPDTYLGIGDFLPARTYEIFDPQTRQWKTSASSKATANQIAVFSDGRVFQQGQILVANPLPKEGEDKEKTIYILEMSDKEGTTWTRIKTPNIPGQEFFWDNAKIFSQSDELFVSGLARQPDVYPFDDVLFWFDQAHNKWQELWRSLPGEHDYANSGRVFVRQLENGKTVVLPLEGYAK
jgi:hypothetical protein